MKSTVRLLILLAAVTALGGCQTTRVAGSCPALPPPPVRAVDALQAAADSAVDAWVVALDRHYQKLDVCAAN